MKPRASSVTEQGEADGWSPLLGWFPERTPMGETRIVISVPPERLGEVHQSLVRSLSTPLSVLYRQRLDRSAHKEGAPPPPDNAPTTDFIALELSRDKVIASLQENQGVIYEDARAELWIRGALQEQLVLDADGILYAYPDDPSFHDALKSMDIPEEDVQTMQTRDYVKHWFHKEHDDQEMAFVTGLNLTRIPTRK